MSLREFKRYLVTVVASVMVMSTAVFADPSSVQIDMVGTVDPLIISVSVPLTLVMVIDPNIEGASIDKTLCFTGSDITFTNNSNVALDVQVGNVTGVGAVGSYPTLVDDEVNQKTGVFGPDKALKEMWMGFSFQPDVYTTIMEGDNSIREPLAKVRLKPKHFAEDKVVKVDFATSLAIPEEAVFSYTVDYIVKLVEDEY